MARMMASSRFPQFKHRLVSLPMRDASPMRSQKGSTTIRPPHRVQDIRPPSGSFPRVEMSSKCPPVSISACLTSEFGAIVMPPVFIRSASRAGQQLCRTKTLSVRGPRKLRTMSVSLCQCMSERHTTTQDSASLWTVRDETTWCLSRAVRRWMTKRFCSSRIDRESGRAFAC